MTGKSLTEFNDWGDEEPNDQNGAEDCLEFTTRRQNEWNDNACNTTFTFICEKNSVF